MTTEYTGGNVILANLTDDELVDLAANWPHQEGLTEGQYNAWLTQAYNLRHIFDNAFTEDFWR